MGRRDSAVTGLGIERKDMLDGLELNDSVLGPYERSVRPLRIPYPSTYPARFSPVSSSGPVYYQPTYGASQSSQRQGPMLLFFIQFYIFASTFSSKIITALPEAESGGTIATLLFVMVLTFNGVMQPPHALSGFCIFVYRVSP
ncbi:aurora kinase A [Aspergillus lentulus]|uniref:Aurora kinase A n=1 Tax=Aspergillus lentulus TaxID=293939 RepID=A0ABQ0ZWD6_ASPLE|nr:aurora kinase A [Aspergillus lentulus]KAF4151864.1 hypothetical protein CNMCM6069_002978 [Aspergillus lentulus]KAF4161847.1 hypothetical protein CNMCM6936_002933 [Aspergillus lentulus]KAF4178067.1 hypothetical protein CNMCM7927_002751 [Aspergillus lentulus]GFF52765.1 aurora kinase A [Aspergillus lentulus]GFF56284.1 aurora kinase A [Aspergillus lentulus]